MLGNGGHKISPRKGLNASSFSTGKWGFRSKLPVMKSMHQFIPI